MDYSWFEQNYFPYFTPNDGVRAAASRLEHFGKSLKAGTETFIAPTLPVLASALTEEAPPTWMFDPAEGSNDRYQLWIATTQYTWATGFRDGYIDWKLDQCPDDKPSCYGMHAARRRQAIKELSGQTKNVFGALVRWIIDNWDTIKQFLQLQTPWGSVGHVLLMAAKKILRFIWDGAKWVFHEYAGASDEDLAAAPELDGFGPFALIHHDGLPQLPLTRVAPGAFSFVSHPEPTPRIVGIDDVQTAVWGATA